jgi:hypothetical protein
VYLGLDGAELAILPGGSAKARQGAAIADAPERWTDYRRQKRRGEQETSMPPTRDFRATVKARADRDPAFRASLYQEAVQALLDGDFGTPKLLLRDVIDATLGFARPGSRTNVPEKSLMQMFGPTGNPCAENLVAVVAANKDECHLTVTVHAAPLRRQRAGTLERATF